ncbi:hypothetical protein [Thiomonas bhubaneswarensis]|uniref:Uncharacterized protein n=1 Tax=Thiomonas bhubaneswarensis TaxID=339866 RepID=A0A0K6I1M4_9BURK|nr:hypothetical protein [Thiomonas bhubaneswarensis]CUA96986.1 hypothetical protein Ga0061069_10549 [Thiomonas bhubaneswarensis]
MNTFDSLLKTQPSLNLQQTGQWFVIRCTPDPYTSERFNIGVAGMDANGVRHAKVMEDPGRLKCLYGESAANIIALAHVAKRCALAGEGSPSTQIEFADPSPFYNSNLPEFLNAAFEQQVTAAIPIKEADARTRIDDDGALRLVSDCIRKTLQLAAEEILTDTPFLSFDTPRGKRSVYAPFVTRDAVGTLKSTDYGAETVRTHLMDAVLDMEFAARFGKKQRQGLFILRPPMPKEKEAQQIDRALDTVLFRAHPILHVEMESTVDALAERVIEWANAA